MLVTVCVDISFSVLLTGQFRGYKDDVKMMILVFIVTLLSWWLTLKFIDIFMFEVIAIMDYVNLISDNGNIMYRWKEDSYMFLKNDLDCIWAWFRLVLS